MVFIPYTSINAKTGSAEIKITYKVGTYLVCASELSKKIGGANTPQKLVLIAVTALRIRNKGNCNKNQYVYVSERRQTLKYKKNSAK